MYKTLFTCAFILIFSGCASVHNGKYANSIPTNSEKNQKNKSLKQIEDERKKQDILVSGSFRNSYCTEYFGFVDITFENKTKNWVRLSDVNLQFTDKDTENKIYIPFGEELSASLEAISMKNAIDQYNTNLLLGSIAAVGATAVLSDNKSMKGAGSLMFLGALGSLTVSDLNNARDNAQNSKLFPKSHIYSGDIIIPPGLFAKRWFLLNSKNDEDMPYVTNVQIEYSKDNNITEKFILNLRGKYSHSYCKWQKSIQPKYSKSSLNYSKKLNSSK